MKGLMVRTQTMKGWYARLAAVILLAALLTAAPFRTALAATAPSLGTAQSFAVLGGSTVTNTGPSVITGDLGVSPGTAVTGFPPGLVIGGTIHAADAVALGAQGANTAAYLNLAGQTCTQDLTGVDLGGLTLVSGVYCFSSSAQLTGALTLNAQGDPNAVWVFQIGSTLTTASNASVVIINGGQQCNVFWQVGSSATLGTTTSFVGNIFALTSITLTTNANVSGRALAQNGAVTMDSNTIAISACGVPPVTPIPPTLGKAFSPATINAGGVSTLTITLSNADATAASLTAPFIDTLPSGVVIAAIPNASTTCGGGTLSVGTSTVTLTGGSIPANASCTVTVDVTAASGGSYINSLIVGALQTSNGSNAAPAVATLTVNTPAGVAPTLSKAFSPATINAGGHSTITITLCNASDSIASLTAPLIDILPSGLVVAGTGPNASTTCGGTLTANEGDQTVTLTGGTIPANGCCTVQFDVYASVGGSYFNSLPAGSLQTSIGNNAAPAVATLTVVPPASVAPTLSKSFSPATVKAGGVSTLTITLSNPNSTVANLTAPLNDYLPSGLVVAGTGPNASTTCGGTLTAYTGDSTVTLTGGSIPANGSCTVTFDVYAPVGGSYVNSLPAGALQTSNGNNTSPAVATLTVKTPVPVCVAPSLSKAFSPATINAGGVSTLTITLNNPDSTVASLTAPLKDYLPSGLVVATNPNSGSTCGGTLTANTGGSKVILTGGSIPANGSCTVTFDVTAKYKGRYYNKLSAGALQTSNGNNFYPAVATLTVKAQAYHAPKLSKAFSPATINAGGVSTLTITLSNPNSTVANLTAPLNDYLPSGVVVATNPNTGTTCGGTLTANTGGSKVTLTGGSIPANGSCTATFDVTAKYKGSYKNKLPAGALQTSNGNNVSAAVATLTVKTRMHAWR